MFVSRLLNGLFKFGKSESQTYEYYLRSPNISDIKSIVIEINVKVVKF